MYSRCPRQAACLLRRALEAVDGETASGRGQTSYRAGIAPASRRRQSSVMLGRAALPDETRHKGRRRNCSAREGAATARTPSGGEGREISIMPVPALACRQAGRPAKREWAPASDDPRASGQAGPRALLTRGSRRPDPRLATRSERTTEKEHSGLAPGGTFASLAQARAVHGRFVKRGVRDATSHILNRRILRVSSDRKPWCRRFESASRHPLVSPRFVWADLRRSAPPRSRQAAGPLHGRGGSSQSPAREGWSGSQQTGPRRGSGAAHVQTSSS